MRSPGWLAPNFFTCWCCPTSTRAARIGQFYSDPRTRTFADLLIDLEEDRAARAMVVGMLRERTHYGRWQEFEES
jgi:hypothetical protein